jgi:hypothetical protein
MYTTLISAALFSLFAGGAVYADTSPDFSVQTPVFTQCALAQFSWDQSSAPYNVILVNSSDPCGEEVANLGDFNGTNLSWTVDLPANWSLMISIEDDNGDEAWSGAITIQPSNDTSCLNTTPPQSSTTTSSKPSHSTGNSSAGTGHNNDALPSHHVTVPTVLLGIIGLAFVLVR